MRVKIECKKGFITEQMNLDCFGAKENLHLVLAKPEDVIVTYDGVFENPYEQAKCGYDEIFNEFWLPEKLLPIENQSFEDEGFCLEESELNFLRVPYEEFSNDYYVVCNVVYYNEMLCELNDNNYYNGKIEDIEKQLKQI